MANIELYVRTQATFFEEKPPGFDLFSSITVGGINLHWQWRGFLWFTPVRDEDYLKSTLEGLTFTRPSDFGAVQVFTDVAGLRVEEPVWTKVIVPDTFVIPEEYRWPPVPRLSIGSTEVIEGNSDHSLTITITASVALSTDYQISVSSIRGTAVDPMDYSASIFPRPVTMKHGETSATFRVLIKGDLWPEHTESFSVKAVSQFGTATGVISIVDDDGPYTRDNIVAAALAQATGATWGARAANAAGDLQTAREVVGTTDTVYRDAEYYALGLSAAVGGPKVTIDSNGIHLTKLYVWLKGTLAQVSKNWLMQTNDHPVSAAGGDDAAMAGYAEGNRHAASDPYPGGAVDAPLPIWVRKPEPIPFLAPPHGTATLSAAGALASGEAVSDVQTSSLPADLQVVTGVTNSSGIAPKIIYDDVYSGTLRLSGAEDYVFGGAGNNVIVAGRGVATVFAGAGNDTVTGGALPDTLDGGVGNDLLNGAGGVDILVGDAGNDRLIGGLHNDVLDGGIGNDRLDGQDGNDLLIGGLGQDTMIGGRGADRFDFNSLRESIRGVARDVIYFQHAERDRLDLSTIDADTDGTAGNQAFKFIGASLFSGVDGQLRYSGGVLQGDTNGDKIPDIEIKVVGTLLAVDVIL